MADANFHCFIVTDPNKPEELADVRHITHEITMKMIEMGGDDNDIDVGDHEELESSEGWESCESDKLKK